MKFIKYTFLFIFIILTFSVITFAQKKKMKHEEYVTEFYYKTDSSTKPYKKKKYLNTHSIFDERNNLIEECEYGEGYSITKHTGSKVSIYHYKDYKKIRDKTFYNYDSNNKLLSENTWRYKENIKYRLSSKYVYMYDKNNQKIAHINEENDTIVYNLIKKNDTLINEKGIKFRVQYEDTIFYNILGNPIFKNEYYKGELNYKREYFYNEKNKLTKEIKTYYLNSLDPEIIKYEYNKNGLILSNKSTQSLSFNNNRIYFYYNNGKMKKEKIYEFDKLRFLISYKYKKIK